MRMFCLAPDEVSGAWDAIAPLLWRFERLCGDLTAVQIREAAQKSTMQLWGLQDAEGVQAVGVTEVVTTANGKECCIRLTCGRASSQVTETLLDKIGEWAKDLGCI